MKWRQPVSEADAAQKARIVQNMLRTRHNAQQIFIDAGCWNAAHPNEPPFTMDDVDPTGELRRAIAYLDEMLCDEVQ